jgi:hypothetical protein
MITAIDVTRAGICLALFSVVCGCECSLSRPVPSAEEYRARYLGHFDQSRVERLDFVYSGAVGGVSTVARIEFAKYERIKVEKGLAENGVYDPAVLNDQLSRKQFEELWAVLSGGKVPVWLDFPFNRQMRTIREVKEGDELSSRQWRTWYIDDERNIVYFLCTEG